MEYTLLSPGDPSLPPALRGEHLPEDWRGMLAAYGKHLSFFLGGVEGESCARGVPRPTPV